MSRRLRAHRGFTLLEVMVAISILGLALTAILSAQTGLFSSAQRVQNLSLATGLVRCKMSEVEVELLEKGFLLTDSRDSGPCCEDDSYPGFECEWRVERVELPELSEVETLAGGESSDSGGGDALSKLVELQSKGKEGLSALGPQQGGDLSGLSSMLGEDPSAGMQGIATTLMSFVYPSLKPMLEASIRKVTVSVQWKEGRRERQLTIEQFITRPQEGLDPLAEEQLKLLAEQEDLAGAAAGNATGTSRGATGTSSRGATGTTRGATGDRP